MEVKAMFKNNTRVSFLLAILLLIAFIGECFADAASDLKLANQYIKSRDYEHAEAIY